MTKEDHDLVAHEEARRTALIEADAAALGTLLADDLIWTHANGATDDKESYLAKLGKVRFENIEPLSQSVLVLGVAGAIKSEFAMQLRLPDGKALSIRSTASSVWSLAESGWQLRRFHSGNLD